MMNIKYSKQLFYIIYLITNVHNTKSITDISATKGWSSDVGCGTNLDLILVSL